MSKGFRMSAKMLKKVDECSAKHEIVRYTEPETH